MKIKAMICTDVWDSWCEHQGVLMALIDAFLMLWTLCKSTEIWNSNIACKLGVGAVSENTWEPLERHLWEQVVSGQVASALI